MPLKGDMINGDTVFNACEILSTVDLVGGDPQICLLATHGELE